MRILKTLAIAALMSTAAIQVSYAQAPQCGERSEIIALISGKHKEQQAAIGLSKEGRLLEIWSNKRSRSFTVLITWPSMRSCIVTAGQEFEMREITSHVAKLEF